MTATATTPVKSPAFEAVEILKGLRSDMESLRRPIYPPGTTPDKIFAQAADHKEEGRWGFKSIGEFTKSLYDWEVHNQMDKRLTAIREKVATGMGEAVGADGGFLVPPTYSNEIMQRVYDNDLIKRTKQYTTTGAQMVFLANAESSRARGSQFGGAQAYWLDEGTAGTATKPTFRRLTLTLHKLLALAYVTDELLADSVVALDSYLNDVFAQVIAFEIGDSYINGTGAGQPLGILNAGATVSVSKRTGQAATTFTTENAVDMYARLWGPSAKNAVWLINQDVLPQLYTMTIGVGTGGVVTYMPPGGLSGQPYSTLMGLPVMIVEFCKTLGTVGDVILCDLSQYLTLTKGAVAKESSIHLKFDKDETAFRVVFRMDAQPWWNLPLTQFQGSSTQAPFITLATRA